MSPNQPAKVHPNQVRNLEAHLIQFRHPILVRLLEVSLLLDQGVQVRLNHSRHQDQGVLADRLLVAKADLGLVQPLVVLVVVTLNHPQVQSRLPLVEVPADQPLPHPLDQGVRLVRLPHPRLDPEVRLDLNQAVPLNRRVKVRLVQKARLPLDLNQGLSRLARLEVPARQDLVQNQAVHHIQDQHQHRHQLVPAHQVHNLFLNI